MTQNAIIKGTDNTVEVNFKFTGDFAENGLNTFTEVKFTVGGETYSTVNNPQNLYIVSYEDYQSLVLDISMVTTLGEGHYLPEIIGYNNIYDDGYILTGKCKPILKYLYVTECR